MRKIICSVLISLLCSATFAQRIAVIDFNAGVGTSQAEIDGISAIFNTYFSPQGYTLVERMRIDRVIDEQQFQRGKLTEQQMVKIGQILNISQIVVGDVNIVMNQYNIDVRVLNVQSGTIAAKDGVTWSPGSSYRTMMQQLATRLASQIAIKPNNVTSSSSSQANISEQKEVIVLYNYLKVYPKDLGKFGSYPQRIVEQINKNADYGYDTWRLPTAEELNLLYANSSELGGLVPNSRYMSKDGFRSGIVRLVTDQEAKAVVDAAYQACTTVEEYQNFINKYPSSAYVKTARKKVEELKIEISYNSCTTFEEYQDFIDKYPSSTYAKMAKKKIYGVNNGHEYVDLGLPSGLKWARCNVGASSPESYGALYAWGEISTKASFRDYNYSYNENPLILPHSKDAARANFGGTWRMPTETEFNELLNECTWIWTKQHSIDGYKIIGPNGNSIFLPAAGEYCGVAYNNTVTGVNRECKYWSSSYSNGQRSGEAAYQFAWILDADSSHKTISQHYHCCGLPIRPVTE